ncbi:MAG: hypothetical protein Q7S09_04790 [bacterium]|nr:hypothetical protein [bacterium]
MLEKMDDRAIIWNKQGRVAVQVHDNRVFDARGNVIGWVRGESVYDKTGRHIGWFHGGILRDMYGKVLGFTERISPGNPHPPLPREKEGAPPSSLEGKTQEKPGLVGAPGLPPLGGKPPLGASWSSFDPQEYFENR